MQKIIINGISSAELVEVQTPEPVKDWALVKINAAPMCTEYKLYRDGEISAYLGHEAAGEVVAVDTSNKVAVGDRVVVMPQYPCGECELCQADEYIHCQNIIDLKAFTGHPEGSATYAQYLIKPETLLPVIPEKYEL